MIFENDMHVLFLMGKYDYTLEYLQFVKSKNSKSYNKN